MVLFTNEADIIMDTNDKKKMKVVDEENEQEYECTSCFKSFPSQTDLDNHWLWHVLQLEHMQSCCVELNQVEIFKCGKCTKYFPNKAKLKEHQEKCQKETSLLEFQNNNNEIEKPFKCTTCGCEFIEESTLEAHSTIHPRFPESPHETVSSIFVNNKDSNMLYENEINKVYENETKNIDSNEINTLNKNETSEVNEIETEYLDEIETNKVDKVDTNEVKEKENGKVDDVVTNTVHEIETNKGDKMESEKADGMKTNKICETETGEVDENETNRVGEIETDMVDDIETDKANEIKIDKIDEIETDKVNENEFTMIYENKNSQLDEDVTNIMNENAANIIEIKDCKKIWKVKLDRVTILRCDFCPCCFLDPAQLKLHQRKYFNLDLSKPRKEGSEKDKPYCCPDCGWRFKEKSTLEAHSVLHKPFPHSCECGIGYYQQCDLDAHRKLLHPNYKPPHIIKPEHIKQQSDSDSEPLSQESDEDLEESPKRKSNNLVPRLKANVTFKRPKNKAYKRKHHKDTSKPKRTKTEITTKLKRGESKYGVKFELEADNDGNYTCKLCTQTFALDSDMIEHLYNDHTHKRGNKCVCNICGKTKPSASGLRFHLLSHAGIKPYVCHICKGRYSQMGALQQHIKRHNDDKIYACTECPKTFVNASTLKLHSRVHTGEKPYECRYCGKSFSDPSAFRRHELIHSGEKPHKCKVCPKAFCDPSALYRHSRLHQGYCVPCSHCDRTFKSKSSMLYHVEQIHTKLSLQEKYKYECDHCGGKYTRKSNLSIHMKNMHLNTQKFQCEICLKKFSLYNGLKRHIDIVHLRLTRFECDLCGARFMFDSQMKKHKANAHKPKMSDRKYECDYCHKIYYRKHKIYEHMRTKHLNIICELCKKAFLTTDKLKRHKLDGCIRCIVCDMVFSTSRKLEDHRVMTHLRPSERPIYECDYCRKQFPLKDRLLQHIKGHEAPAGAFQCDYCSKVFSRKFSIRLHIWEKHMVTLYCNICMKMFEREHEFRDHKRAGACVSREVVCEICNKKFRDSASLKVHLLYHGPKRKQCDMCGYKCTQNSALIRHFKLVHTPKFKHKKSK